MDDALIAETPEPARAVAPDRILSLDVIRGIAVMGIFSVNVVGMAMIENAYFYPPDYGFHSTGDTVMWALNAIFVDGRFRALFSILFGASMTLVIERALAAGQDERLVHFSRMVVLLGFGLLHFYVLWWGDILANYALIGMFAFLFRRLPAKWLLITGIAVLAAYYAEPLGDLPRQIAAIESGQSSAATAAERARSQALLDNVTSSPAQIARDKREHASITAHVRAATRADHVGQPFATVVTYGFETLGLMLVGMAAFKAGFLIGAWDRRTYILVAVGFLAPDLLLRSYAVYRALASEFAPQVFYPWVNVYVAPFRAIGALGYAALIIVLIRRPGIIADRVGAVGRTAFTNYLGATVVGSLLFYGTFGGLYGQLSRGECWLVVPPVWAAMLLWSKPWLERYRYGPFEWAWRSLARWRWEPLRRLLPAASA